ncbi:MAG: metallophosphoesterase family protein [Opitutae bacterium]|nr:metallophosphoesterase family protein [Opitutae bacterium]
MKLKVLALSLLLSSPLVSFKLFSETPWLDKDYVEKRMKGMTPVQGDGPSQWRVIWTEEPSTRATISWTTAKKGSVHKVRYGIRSTGIAELSTSQSQEAQRSDAYSSAKGEYYHHARISGLKPSTTYDFEIESDGKKSPVMHFTTAPADDREFRLLFGGDSRTGIVSRGQVNLLMVDLSEKDDQLIAFAHGGDYIVSGKSWSQWSTWLSQHELTVAKSGKVLPIIPTRGNHDGGPLYDEIFDTPGGAGKNYFHTMISPKVALVTLNSEISAGGEQQAWLAKTLFDLRPKVRWLLAEYHRPVWPAVKGPGKAKNFWVPLFEKFNLDLAVESDGHVIKRTVPIRNEKKDPTGIVYVGEGGLGVPQRKPKSDRWYLQKPGMTGAGHHVMRVTFGKTKMDYEVVLLDRNRADKHQFSPR